MAEYLLPKLTSALLQRTPDITLKMVIGQDDLLRESLRSGQLDMIICALITDDEQFQSFAILKDEAVVIASKDHPIFKARYSMADLCTYRWVLPPTGVSSRKWLDRVFAAENLPLPVVQIEANSIPLLPGLIERTSLLSFTARETLEFGNNMQHLREVVVKQTTMKRTIGCTVRKGGYLSPAAQAMVQMLHESSGEFLSWS